MQTKKLFNWVLQSTHRFEILRNGTTPRYQPVRNYAKGFTKVYSKEKSVYQTLREQTPESYKTLRYNFFKGEISKLIGHRMRLNKKEKIANKILMKAKRKDYKIGLVKPAEFLPAQHIFSVLDKVRKTDVFKFISKMPKGGILHAHSTALCNTKYLIKLTYRKNLWACTMDKGCEIVSFKFAKKKPKEKKKGKRCKWELMCAVRDKLGAKNVDRYLSKRFTMVSFDKHLDSTVAWKHFDEIFDLLNGLLNYAPVWYDYNYEALTQMHCDNVQYLEMRSQIPKLYQIDGKELNFMDTVSICKQASDKFVKEYPTFIGSRIIYAPLRTSSSESLEKYVAKFKRLQKKYEGYIVGFDLVGQEQLGRPLKDFAGQLLKLPKKVNLFFTAGQTKWYGTSVDENLFDAILLGSKRIGHGFALVKHPVALRLMKRLDIAVEVNPISNQILQLVSDFRNHPCSFLFANNFPVVISSDDPSFWKTTPLSHDYYIAFLGIASAHSDLRMLKKLAVNSLFYSFMKKKEKNKGFLKWKSQWSKFISNICKDAKKKKC